MSDRDHEHAVGDVVYVVDFDGRPRRRTKVAAVKSYKRGPKVTTTDGSEWDVQGGCIWGQRSANYYTGPHLAPTSPERETAFKVEVALSDLRWLERHFRDLTTEEQLEVGAAIRAVRKSAASRG